MAVKRTRRVRRGADNSGETKAEAHLAPPEEKGGAGRSSGQASTNDGTLPVPTGELKLPPDLAEEDTETTGLQRIDPVVLGIFCFSLVFIVVIAYIVWNGWEPPK